MKDLSGVRALLFDTFGTVVDWRGSIIAEGEEWGRLKGLKVDWAGFADSWRGEYVPSMNRVRTGEIPWQTIDRLHRQALETVLPRFGMNGLSELEKDNWNRVWHRLLPWPDSVAGLTALKQNYIIAPLGNANVSLLANMAKNAGLPWDCILSAELARHYKPDPETYLKAAELLDLEPGYIMMVAAHSYDLKAAAALGFCTAFIHRPAEFGPARQADKAQPGEFDIVTDSLPGLADQLRRGQPVLGNEIGRAVRLSCAVEP